MLVNSHEHRLNLYKMQVVMMAGGRKSGGADANWSTTCFHQPTVPDKVMLFSFKKLIQTDLTNSLVSFERSNRTRNLLERIGVKKEVNWETTVSFLL